MGLFMGGGQFADVKVELLSHGIRFNGCCLRETNYSRSFNDRATRSTSFVGIVRPPRTNTDDNLSNKRRREE